MDLILQLSSGLRWALAIYGWVIIAAFLLSWVDADPNNGLVRFINGITVPFWQAVGRRLPEALFPLAPIAALLLVDFLEVFLPGTLRSLGAAGLAGMAPEKALVNVGLYAAIGALLVLRSLMFFLVLLAVLYFVFTLVAPPMTNPIVRSVTWMIDPFLRPLQRLLPRANLDLSPIVLGLGLYIAMTALSPLLGNLQRHLSI